jgi:hypothetical protein
MLRYALAGAPRISGAKDAISVRNRSDAPQSVQR